MYILDVKTIFCVGSSLCEMAEEGTQDKKGVPTLLTSEAVSRF